MEQRIIYWTISSINQYSFIFAKSNQGLCYIDCNDHLYDSLKRWIKKHKLNDKLIQSKEPFILIIEKLKRYFKGEHIDFNEEIDLHGTCFQKSVWRNLQRIPYGKTITYSELAKQINRPKAVRAVANAIGANPLLIVIPCHRIIGKDGSLTGFRAGLKMKKELLSLESSS